MNDPRNLQTEVISTPAGLPALESDWTRLWVAQARREVFTGFPWAAASWEAFGSSNRLCVVVVRRGGEVVGLLPLSGAGERLRFLGGHHADYNDILVGDGDAAPVVAAAIEAALAQGGGRPLALENLPEWSTLCRTLEALPAALRARISVAEGPPCPALRLGEDREALLAAMVGKQSLKRHEKKLAKLGRLTLRHLEDYAAIAERFPDFFAQHVARRAVAGERSLFLDEASRAFYAQLIRRLDPAAELRFAVLEVEDRVVAYHMGFEVAGRFTWYKPTFDVDYWDYGAGEVLLKQLLEYVRGRVVHEFDFTRGAESFKDRFSNHAGRNAHWTIHASAGAAQRAAAREEALRGLREGNGAATVARHVGRVLRGPWHEAPSRLVEHLLLPAARFAWTSDEWVAWSAERTAVLDRAAGVPANESGQVRRGTLRELAMLAVRGSRVLALADVPAARVRFSHGETAHFAFTGGTLTGLAWLAIQSELVARWSDGVESRTAFAAPAAVIEIRGRMSAATLAALIRDLAGQVAEAELWLLLPATGGPQAGDLAALGFQPRYRIGRSSVMGRTRGPWVTPASR